MPGIAIRASQAHRGCQAAVTAAASPGCLRPAVLPSTAPSLALSPGPSQTLAHPDQREDVGGSRMPQGLEQPRATSLAWADVKQLRIPHLESDSAYLDDIPRCVLTGPAHTAPASAKVRATAAQGGFAVPCIALHEVNSKPNTSVTGGMCSRSLPSQTRRHSLFRKFCALWHQTQDIASFHEATQPLPAL